MSDKQLIESIHPGVTSEDYLKPLGMSVNALAGALKVPATRLNEIVRGRRGITADTALRLSRYFDTTPDFWLGLQSEYELRKARLESGKKIQREVAQRARPEEYA